MKNIVCPHCHTTRSADHGVRVALKLGLICTSCEKVIFPTKEESELKIAKSKSTPVTTPPANTIGGNVNPFHHGNVGNHMHHNGDYSMHNNTNFCH